VEITKPTASGEADRLRRTVALALGGMVSLGILQYSFRAMDDWSERQASVAIVNASDKRWTTLLYDGDSQLYNLIRKQEASTLSVQQRYDNVKALSVERAKEFYRLSRDEENARRKAKALAGDELRQVGKASLLGGFGFATALLIWPSLGRPTEVKTNLATDLKK